MDVATPLVPRFAAVLVADVVGYSRLMAADPNGTVADLDATRTILRRHVEAHGGRIANEAGDATVAAFDTALGAVLAAAETQSDVGARAEVVDEARRMLLRVGVHVGDLLEQRDGSILGDTVNIAARLESLAPAGGVAVSDEARRLLRNDCAIAFEDHGEYRVKNIPHPVRLFLVRQDGGPTTPGALPRGAFRVAKGNLPETTSPLFGRSDALEQVGALLDRSRLVTLFGMGGLGKTRLSIEAARRAAPDFPDGVWFADLAAVEDAAAVAHAVAAVFSVAQKNADSMERALVEALKWQRLLIVIDNCEHVTAAAAKLVEAILGNCPSVKMIATSREALSIGDEHVWPITPLETAGTGSPAVQLFVERAQAVHPAFDPRLYADDIVRICEALDGIPLAIELAAARVRSLSPHQILARLDERFRLLTRGSRTVSARHQTLLNAIRWSYDLLADSERIVLARATVFAGGLTLEAAEAVCAGGAVDAVDICDILDSLVRKSLVLVARRDDSVRYGMLETIRAFAGERLAEMGEEHAVREAHARFFADEADENFAIWRSPEQMRAHAWLDLELNNLRNAIRWAIENGDTDPAARIASSVGDMGRFRLIEEAAGWAEEVVEMAREARHPRLAILLTWSASSAWAFMRFDEARRFAEEAIGLLDDDRFDPFAWAYGDLAFVSLFAGEVDEAIRLLRTGAEHPADAHDRFMLAFHLYLLATTGQAGAARAIADGVVARVDAAGVPMAIAVAHAGKGAALEGTDDKAALAAYEHAVDVARRAGARFMETLIAPRAAALHARSGEPRVALEGFERMLESFGAATDIAAVSTWRTALIVLLARLGHYHAAATLYGTLSGRIDPSGVVPAYAEAIAQVGRALGETVFSSMAARGSGMSLQEVADYAGMQVRLSLSALDARAAG
jgi:predicted ATPase/class 3 adenylate cyclase